MSESDPRKVVGSRVYAKAKHVMALAECHRRYGARAKKKELPGVVVELIEERTKNNRVNNFVVADYMMGETITKRKKLNIRSVLREATDSIDSLPLVVANTTRKNTENVVASEAQMMANDGAAGVDGIKFVAGGGQGVLESRECGCGSEGTRICGVHSCVLCREKWPVSTDESIYQNRCKDHATGMEAAVQQDNSRKEGGEEEGEGGTSSMALLSKSTPSPNATMPNTNATTTNTTTPPPAGEKYSTPAPSPMRLSLSPTLDEMSRNIAEPPSTPPTIPPSTTTAAGGTNSTSSQLVQHSYCHHQCHQPGYSRTTTPSNQFYTCCNCSWNRLVRESSSHNVAYEWANHGTELCYQDIDW
eukprot:scaffold4223_cov60-Attheya_sp.AAC.1